MPNALKWLHDTGIVSSEKRVNEKRYALLCHLLEPPLEGEPRPTPRLYIGDARKAAHLSHSGHSHGRPTRVDMEYMLGEKLIELDPEETARCKKGIQAYRISDTGREAVVQVRAHGRFRRFMEEGIPQILAEERLRAGLITK